MTDALQELLDRPAADVKPNAQLFEDMSIEEYHSRKDVISKSMLSEMGCPAKFKWKYIDNAEQPDKDYFNVGNAVHTLALEPGLFHDRFYVIPEGIRRDPRTKEFKICMAEAGQRKMLTAKDHASILGMAKSLAADKKSLALLQGAGKIEPSIFWTDDETKIRMRSRPDFMRDDGLIVDLKTGASANPDNFFRSAWENHYDVSAAMTTEGYQALYGKLPDNYVFLVIEKEPPYLIEAFDAFRPCEGSDPSGMSYYDAGVHRFRQAPRYEPLARLFGENLADARTVLWTERTGE